MSNDLVRYQWQDQELTLTKSDVRNLISTDPNVTDKEIQLFMELCRYQSLNPFIREVYLIKYGNKKAQMVTGIETFTKRMENHKDFDGVIPSNNYDTTQDKSKWWSEVAVYRKNLKYPIIHRVYYEEYVGTTADGQVTKIWDSKSRTMLDKCALMGGGRKAFPTALGGLYEENELDQQAVPKDITPKDIVEKVVKGVEKQIIEGAEASKDEVNRDNEAIDEIEVLEQEQAKATEEDVSEEEIKPADFKPASDKQKDYIYGTSTSKGIIESHLITKEEVKRIGLVEDLDIEKASKILAWWWGDKAKNIIGEREKREKNPKVGDSDFERRGILMKEVLDLMKENHIKPAEAKKMYKKYQKDEIIKLAFEELEELKGLLENYVPNWK